MKPNLAASLPTGPPALEGTGLTTGLPGSPQRGARVPSIRRMLGQCVFSHGYEGLEVQMQVLAVWREDSCLLPVSSLAAPSVYVWF